MVLDLHPPRFGRQVVQIRSEDDVRLCSTSETIVAEDGEGVEPFLRRLATAREVTPDDRVEIIYKAGAPQYAVIHRRGCQGT